MDRRYAALLAAVMISAGILSGCSSEEDSVQTASETASVQTTAAAAPAVMPEIYEPVHDFDPAAMKRAGDGLPWFRAEENEEVTFYPDERSVKRCGRYIERNDIYYLSYTCSAVSFVMSGDRVSAVLTSNGNVYSDNQQGYIGVLINGKLTKRIRLEAGDNEYVLYDGDNLTNAEISIIKLTENQMASTGIVSITANATKLAPKAQKDKRIEIIGDSITCGYGNEADGPEDGYNSSQQNGYETFGRYLADELNADYSLVCISGIGLISDYTDYVGEKQDYLLMPDVYDYSDANFELRRGIDRLTEWDYDGGSDIVIISLGTNDYSYTGKDEELQAGFEEAYYDFLTDVREHNPHAKIICAMGTMGGQLYDRIEAAVTQFCTDYGDKDIHPLKLSYQKEKNGFGGDYHPTIATHKELAQEYLDFINTLE